MLFLSFLLLNLFFFLYLSFSFPRWFFLAFSLVSDLYAIFASIRCHNDQFLYRHTTHDNLRKSLWCVFFVRFHMHMFIDFVILSATKRIHCKNLTSFGRFLFWFVSLLNSWLFFFVLLGVFFCYICSLFNVIYKLSSCWSLYFGWLVFSSVFFSPTNEPCMQSWLTMMNWWSFLGFCLFFQSIFFYDWLFNVYVVSWCQFMYLKFSVGYASN